MRRFIFTISLLILLIESQAQKTGNKYSFTLNTGSSLSGIAFKSLGAIKYVDSYTTPVFQITGDYNIKKWFSVGLSTSYERMGLTLDNYEIRTPYDTVDSKITIDLNRYNICTRALFHYCNHSRIDMYSGIRLGYNLTSIRHTATAPLFDYLDRYEEFREITDFIDLTPEDIWNPIKRHKFAYQFVLFGMRSYLSENIGVNFEVALGKPYFFSTGVCARF